MSIEFVVKTILPATTKEVYDAWMSSEGHSEMTGSPATISPDVGAEFEAWDGYIHGRNLILEPGVLIVQSWRTTDFADDEKDSMIEINLKPAGDETELTLRHSELPPHGQQYESGWEDSYFAPMKEYFSKKRSLASTT